MIRTLYSVLLHVFSEKKESDMSLTGKKKKQAFNNLSGNRGCRACSIFLAPSKALTVTPTYEYFVD